MYMMSLLAEGGGGVASDIKSCTRNYKELKLFIIYFLFTTLDEKRHPDNTILLY